MENYQAGQNSALWYIARKEIKCPFRYGTIQYNDWFVGFCDELNYAGEKIPQELIC